MLGYLCTWAHFHKTALPLSHIRDWRCLIPSEQLRSQHQAPAAAGIDFRPMRLVGKAAIRSQAAKVPDVLFGDNSFERCRNIRMILLPALSSRQRNSSLAASFLASSGCQRQAQKTLWLFFNRNGSKTLVQIGDLAV